MRLTSTGFFFFILLLASLETYMWSGLAIFSLTALLLSAIFILFNTKKISLKREYLIYLFIILVILSILYAGSIIFSIDIDSKRLIGFHVLFLTLLIAPFFVDFISSKFFKIIILIHLVFFYIQFFSYYLFGIYLDFHFFAESYTRSIGGSFKVPFFEMKIMRSTGLFTEPGNYSNYMFLFYTLHHVFDVRNVDRIKGYFFIFFIASLILSFSAFGAIFALVILFSRIEMNKLNSIGRTILPLLLFSFMSFPYFQERFGSGVDSTDTTSINFRYEYIEDAATNFSSLEGWIVGKGTLSAPSYFVNKIGSDNDTGLVFFILREMGVLIAFIFTLSIIYIQVRNKFSILIMACIFTKLTPFSFFIPLFFSLLFFKYKSLRSE